LLVYSDAAPLFSAHSAVVFGGQVFVGELFADLSVHFLSGFGVERFGEVGFPVEIASGGA